MGIAKTDAFVMKLSELFGKPVPAQLKAERGRAVDAMTDAQQYIHGKKLAVYGDSDYLLGYVSFLLEMGAVPYHILCSKGSKKLERELHALLDASPFGKASKVYMTKTCGTCAPWSWTDKVDGIIGDTQVNKSPSDSKIPLFALRFSHLRPVNLHRRPLIGYQGVINMLTEICNKYIGYSRTRPATTVTSKSCADWRIQL